MSPRELTVVVPCHNHFDFLRECLRSLIAQTFGDWRAVIVDDASTDGDAAAVVAALNDPRFTSLRHETNRGLAAARNTGFRAANSELVLPLDGDDLLTPDALAELSAPFLRDDPVDCVFSDFALFGAREGEFKFEARPLAHLAETQWLPGAGVLMRSTVWENAGGYCEAPELRHGNEDWDFWLSAARVPFRVVHVPKPLYRYRQHGGSLSPRLRRRDPATRRFIHQRHREFFEKHGAKRFFADGHWRAANAASENRDLPRALWHCIRAAAFDRDWRRLVRNTINIVRTA